MPALPQASPSILKKPKPIPKVELKPEPFVSPITMKQYQVKGNVFFLNCFSRFSSSDFKQMTFNFSKFSHFSASHALLDFDKEKMFFKFIKKGKLRLSQKNSQVEDSQ